jgi:hypothetical protein
LLCTQGDSEGRMFRDQEVGGSNPLAPTNPIKDIQTMAELEDALCDVDCDVTLQNSLN